MNYLIIITHPVDVNKHEDLLSSINTQHRTDVKQKYRVVIAGVAKGIASSHIRIHVPKLIRLGEAFDSYHIVLYENDSGPDTRDTYKTELGKTKHSTYLFEDGINKGSRTSNLAYARGKVLDYVRENLAEKFDYLLITDQDAVCGGADMTLSYDSDIFKYVLSRSGEWDAVSFRFIPYWDLWAFRDKDHMPENLFGPNVRKNTFHQAAEFDKWLDSHSPIDLIPVESAFMMLSIYKIDKTIGCNYSNKGIHGEDDCEHVALHREMIQQNNARIRLMPIIYCQGDDGYKSLEQLGITLK
jgi:hypothetical protein